MEIDENVVVIWISPKLIYFSVANFYQHMVVLHTVLLQTYFEYNMEYVLKDSFVSSLIYT